MPANTRAYAARVDVRASTERTWRALTDTAALTRWLSSDAKSAAREGGLMSGRLDRRYLFQAHIDVCDAPRRLRLVHLHPETIPPFEGAIVDDIVVQGGAEATVVRVLGSGFPRATEYGPFYMIRQLGWRAALARLKVYLDTHMDQKLDEAASLRS
jgi:uncharacterized protein YndB with AHSA1/START domain